MGLVCCSTLIPKNSVSGKITRQKSTKRSCSITDDSEFFLLTKRLSGLGEMGLLVLPCEAYRCTLLTRWRSKWANIGHVLFALLLIDTTLRSIKTQKRTRPIFTHFDRTSFVNNGFITWPKREHFLSGPSRRGQNGPILHVRVANQKAGVTSSCPLADSAI